MDKERLADRLAAGDSIEAIAREVGRHPSTVAYWVGKHGLRSTHADRHAARGGLEREVLAPLVEEGLTIRAIAAKLGVSGATVRHWLGVHGLQTRRATNGQAVRASRRVEEGRVTADCPIHGTTTFVGSAEGGWRCIACRSERVSERRRAQDDPPGRSWRCVRAVRLRPVCARPRVPPPRPVDEGVWPGLRRNEPVARSSACRSG